MSSNTKFNTITKKYKTTIIFLVVIVIIILLYIIYKYWLKQYWLKQYINKNKSNFVNATPVTTEPDEISSDEISKGAFGKDGPPVMGEAKGCSAVSDVVDFCKDYDICCANYNSNNKCFCEHPITKSCKSIYDTCMNDPTNIKLFNTSQLTDKCKSMNNECCKSYNKIAISSNNFNSPIKRNQTDNVLCNVSSIKNIEQKCMELCNTTPECAAYSTTKLTCNLYKSVSDFIPSTDAMTGNTISSSNVDFFTKK